MSAGASQFNWAHNQERTRGQSPLNRKLSSSQRTQIAARANAGETPQALALEFRISAKYVRELRNRYQQAKEE